MPLGHNPGLWRRAVSLQSLPMTPRGLGMIAAMRRVLVVGTMIVASLSWTGNVVPANSHVGCQAPDGGPCYSENCLWQFSFKPPAHFHWYCR